MDNVFKYFNGFFKGLTGLIMTVLGLGVAPFLVSTFLVASTFLTAGSAILILGLSDKLYL